MESSTEENERLVTRVCDGVRRANERNEATPDETRLIYEIDSLVMEVNSGASFEQYFRWSKLEQITKIVNRLETVGLVEAAQITTEAILTAYPNGLPPLADDSESLSDWDGSEEQMARLSELADEFTEYNGVIINRLANYARQFGFR